jgi:DNA polymerase III delta subunit
MKIVIVNGDDITASRQRYYQIISSVKKRGWEINKYEDDNTSLSEILNSQSLFGSQILVVSEFSNILDSDLKWLKSNHSSLNSMLLVYSKKKLSKTQTNKFPQAKVEEFNLPVVLFKFLDSLYPGNSKQTIQLLTELLEQTEIEFVFIMLARQFRDLLLVSQNPNTTVYPSWRTGKLKSQASKFRDNQLKQVISYLAKLDLQIKTGKADLLTSLTLLFAKDYQV